MRTLRRITVVAAAAIGLASLASAVCAQVVGTTTVGLSVTKMEVVAVGWSAKKQILGASVFNGVGERVGRIEDLIVTPDSAVSFAVVGAGWFVGLERHDVLIPIEQFTLGNDGTLVLPGATKEAIKQLPPFEYAKR